MRFKDQILTRLDASDTQLEYLSRQINHGAISGEEAINLISKIKKLNETIRDHLSLEGNQ